MPSTSPEQVLARTNHVLADLESDLLVSCLYVHLDLARDRAVLASADHPPPLVYQPGLPRRVVRLDPGPLLGIETSTGYPTTVQPLAPATTLALYTDGLLETMLLTLPAAAEPDAPGRSSEPRPPGRR
ncbi:PP2C family protein-serine/threonine phosphatase [Kitasatospora sp. NPDC092039]|uniref:PP2C family protein-serine/threonine phosphatase n=1 Tax=Kitasatospora sp. NPDC092039 TaxID=3364086 RepID=UPI003818E9F1